MDFFEFWFWHRWFHRDDPNYDDSSVFDGFMKLLLVLFLLVLITMTATKCQNEKSSDREIITSHQDIRTPAVQRTSDKQTSGQQQIKNQSATLKSTAQQKQHATATTSKTTASKTATSKTATAATKQVADAKRAKSAANQLQKSSAVQNAVVTTTAATTATSPAQSAGGQKPAVKKYNKQYLEVFTEKGELLMYVGMPKDSVKMLMGAPYSTRAYNSEYFGLQETWEYMGRNKYVSEFTFEFENGRLKSLRQYRER